MACKVVDLGNGATAIVCTRGVRETCWNRGCDRKHEALCDWPMGNGKTCDRRLCYKHRHPISKGIDYCSEHMMASKAVAAMTPAQRDEIVARFVAMKAHREFAIQHVASWAEEQAGLDPIDLESNPGLDMVLRVVQVELRRLLAMEAAAKREAREHTTHFADAEACVLCREALAARRILAAGAEGEL